VLSLLCYWHSCDKDLIHPTTARQQIQMPHKVCTQKDHIGTTEKEAPRSTLSPGDVCLCILVRVSAGISHVHRKPVDGVVSSLLWMEGAATTSARHVIISVVTPPLLQQLPPLLLPARLHRYSSVTPLPSLLCRRSNAWPSLLCTKIDSRERR
jgi:hypothetical protein